MNGEFAHGLDMYVLGGDGALAAVSDCAILLPSGAHGGRALAWCRALTKRCEEDPSAALTDQWAAVQAAENVQDIAVLRLSGGALEVVLHGEMRCVVEPEGGADGESPDTSELQAFGGLGVSSTELWFPEGFDRVGVASTGQRIGGTFSRMPLDDEMFVAAAGVAYVRAVAAGSAASELVLFSGDRATSAPLVGAGFDKSLVAIFSNGTITRIGRSLKIFGGAGELHQSSGITSLTNHSLANYLEVILDHDRGVTRLGVNDSITIDTTVVISYGEDTIRLGNLRT